MMRLKILFPILYLMLMHGSLFAQKITFSGYVKDSTNNEALIGASIQVLETQQSVSTNAYGFFSLTIDKGKCTLLISHLGYQTVEKSLMINEKGSFNLLLSPKTNFIKEVVVSSERNNRRISSTEMSVDKLNASIIKQVPTVLGEADILKVIQMLPGVTSPNEGASGFNVRGGAADQNLILLDEAIVYNPSHLLGFFSIFNADAIKNVTLHKGGIPSEFGGRLSSILDVRMNDGNNKKMDINGGIGLLSSRLTVEGPLGKVSEDGAKGSFLMSGRRSYADIFLPLAPDTTARKSNLYFYDLNFRSNYKLGAKDKIYLSGYFGKDLIKVPNSFENNWGNTTATLRWNHTFGKKLFMNVSAIYANYIYKITFFPANSFIWSSALSNVHIKSDVNYYLNGQNTLKFGLGSIAYTFSPGDISPAGTTSTIKNIQSTVKKALENAFYMSNEQKITPSLTINYGLRLSHFSRLATDSLLFYQNDAPVVFNNNINNYQSGQVIEKKFLPSNKLYSNSFGFEPRVSINFRLNENNALKGSYNRMFQYIHLLSASTSPTPLDVYTPSSEYLKPQIADQVAIGFFKNMDDSQYEFRLFWCVQYFYQNKSCTLGGRLSF